MSSSRLGRPSRFVVRAAIFFLVFGVVAEVWLRTVMPACETPVPYQQQPSTIYRFDPHGPTSGLYSVGRLCLRGGGESEDREANEDKTRHAGNPRVSPVSGIGHSSARPRESGDPGE